MVRLIGVDDSGNLGGGAAEVISRANTPSERRNLVSIIGDSFSSTGYGSNYGHIWHTVAMSHADGTLVGNYAENGHTALDAWEGRTEDWGPDPENSQIAKAEADPSQTVLICLGYNDQNNGVSQEDYESTMRLLVERVVDAGKRAIVVEPPVPLASRAAAIPDLRVYLSGLRDLAKSSGGVFLPTWDLLGGTRGVSDDFGQGDGSHMSSLGHDAFGLIVAPRVREAIGGLSEFPATRTPAPVPQPAERMMDGNSTCDEVSVPLSSRDLFPSGRAYLMDLGVSDDPYVSVGIPYRGDDIGGKLLRFTFAYEIVSLDESKVENGTMNAGLFAQTGQFNPWIFSTVWGSVKLNGSRGVAAVTTRVPEGLTEWVCSLSWMGIARTEGDTPAQVRIGSARIEEVN